MEYKEKAIACLKKQLEGAQTQKRKEKLKLRIEAWESGNKKQK